MMMWALFALLRPALAEAQLQGIPSQTLTAITNKDTGIDPIASISATKSLTTKQVDLKSLGQMAVLPLANPDNYVFEYIRKRGLSDQLKNLEPNELIDDSVFNPKRFKVCLYLSGEEYLRTVKTSADADRALRAYTEAGGILVVLATGPYPFYLDENGGEVITGSYFGLTLLGAGEQEDGVGGFETPPSGQKLRFNVIDNSFRSAGGLSAQLRFPDTDDQRWRPLTRFAPRYPYEPWVRLEDANDSSLGEAAAWVEKTQQDGKVLARTAYASYLITQQHPQRDKVLDAIFRKVAQKLAHPEKNKGVSISAKAGPCDRVHVFYYNWYGAPPFQPNYVHWQQAGHEPPNDISANYYPSLGAYSSGDPQVLKQHMEWIRQARIGVLCTTWWGKGSYEDRSIPAILDAAAKAGLKVNFHLEPYGGRTPESVMDDIRYIINAYGGHPAFYHTRKFGGRPMFYVFAVRRHDPNAWHKAIEKLRNTKYDSLLIAYSTDPNLVKAAGFDGGYNYGILDQFKDVNFFKKQWVEKIAPGFAAVDKLFIPSVGPGFWAERAAPGRFEKIQTALTRDDGTDATYKRGWKAAIEIGTPFVTITSFNEWHESSQIEPAVERSSAGNRYPGYKDGPLQYIRLTADLVSRFEHSDLNADKGRNQSTKKNTK